MGKEVSKYKGKKKMFCSASSEVTFVHTSFGVHCYGKREWGTDNMEWDELSIIDKELSNLDVKFIAPGRYSFAAITTDGTVFLNGDLGSHNQFDTLTKVEGIPPIKTASIGWKHAVLIDEDGVPWSAGDCNFFQLGRDATDKREKSGFSRIQFVKEIEEVSCGFDHTILRDVRGRICTFGRNNRGQLGLGEEGPEESNLPNWIPLPDGIQPVTARAGGFFSMFLTEIGEVWVTGDNDSKQLLLLSSFKQYSFVHSTAFPMMSQISLGSHFGSGIDFDGKVWVFGQRSKNEKDGNSSSLMLLNIPTFVNEIMSLLLMRKELFGRLETMPAEEWESPTRKKLKNKPQSLTQTSNLVLCSSLPLNE